MTTTLPRLAMTLGDPAGIGPEIAAKLLAEPGTLDRAHVLLLADEAELAAAAADGGVDVTASPGRLDLVGSDRAGVDVPRAEVSRSAGERVMADLQKALRMFEAGEVDSILFSPLNKSSLHLAGMHEEDELRWFAKLLGHEGVTSELNFVPGLVTSRVTSHVPVSGVSERINARAVLDAIALLDDVVRGTGVEAPRLAVCALNPHAGENGAFGREEIEHIAPGVELARGRGIDATGPFPCDTIFLKARAGDYDGVVTMYHDQGQIAMKLMGFEQGVTVQGGLPVPIATPAHGSAFEIVGQQKASIGSISRAFDIAVSLGAQRRTTVAA